MEKRSFYPLLFERKYVPTVRIADFLDEILQQDVLCNIHIAHVALIDCDVHIPEKKEKTADF